MKILTIVDETLTLESTEWGPVRVIRVYRVILLDGAWFTSLEFIVFLFFFDDVHMRIKGDWFFLVFESITIVIQTAEMFELPYIGFDSRQRDTSFWLGNKAYGAVVFLLGWLSRISTSLEFTILDNTENRWLLQWNLILIWMISIEAPYLLRNLPNIYSFICCEVLLWFWEIFLFGFSFWWHFESRLSSLHYTIWFLFF